MLEAVLTPVATRRRNLRLGRDTREQILNSAEELLQRRGYNGFAYQHISVQLGIRNAAIHYHFPSKENLGVAVVQRFRQRFHEWAEETNGIESAWLRLKAYFKTYQDYVDAECKICPQGVLSSELEAIPEVMREEARLMMREVFDWVAHTLEDGREQHSISFLGDARHKALQILAALQGALQIARMAGKERFEQVVEQISLELPSCGTEVIP